MAAPRKTPASPADISPVTAAVLAGASIRLFERIALEIQAEVTAFEVVDEHSKVTASDHLVKIRTMLRNAEAKRSEIVAPHNNHVAAVNAFFKRMLEPLVHADGLLSGRMLDYNRRQAKLAAERAAEAERLRLESAALLQEAERTEAAALAAPVGAPERAALPAVADTLATRAADVEVAAREAQAGAVLPSRSVRTDSGTTSTQKRWTFDLIDIAQVPRLYLVLDSALVQARMRDAIRAGVTGDALEHLIPGIRIYQTESLVTRGG